MKGKKFLILFDERIEGLVEKIKEATKDKGIISISHSCNIKSDLAKYEAIVVIEED